MTEEERNQKKRSYDVLKVKSDLYDKIQSGEVQESEYNGVLVNFSQKREEEETFVNSHPNSPNPTPGSLPQHPQPHLDSTPSPTNQWQWSRGEESDESSNNRFREEYETKTKIESMTSNTSNQDEATMSKSAKVKSANFERTLDKQARDLVDEIHNQTVMERTRGVDGGSTKEDEDRRMRLERLRAKKKQRIK